MQIDGNSYLSTLASQLARGTSAIDANSPGGSVYDPTRAILGDTFARAIDLGASLAELDQLISAAEPGRTRRALAASTAPLDLGLGALTPTTLRSSEEVNATPTSFSPFGPTYDLPATSTAEPTLDGVYNGSNGTDTLTFEVTKGGSQPGNNLRLEVRDSGGNLIDEIRMPPGDPVDQQYTLSNGLVFTLGAGELVKNDTFTVEVFADLGSVVDPDKAFDGVRNDKPNLEYGLSVTDGSFDINGINILVNASDSINDVLARINASGADVTAEFDVATETIILTRNTPGSGFDITLQNDTSGFLAATKLDNAIRVPGGDGDSNSPLNELPQFAAVVNGTFKVNGVDITLDVAVDSLEDVLARIDAAAQVRTSIINDRVFFEATHRRDAMVLEDAGTGLFDALNIREGRYKPRNRDGIDLDSAKAIAISVGQATAAVDRLLETRFSGTGVPAQVSQLQARVRSVLGSAEGVLLEKSQPKFGLAFDLSGTTRPSLTLLDASELVQSLRVDFSAFKAAFTGATPDARDGFVRQLLSVVNQFTAALRNELGNNGFLADLSV